MRGKCWKENPTINFIFYRGGSAGPLGLLELLGLLGPFLELFVARELINLI